MTDLSTGYLGMRLRNPLVVSASPLSDRIETLRQLEACGAAAVVMRSLFEEQIEQIRAVDPSLQQALCHMMDLPVPTVIAAARDLLAQTEK